MLQKNKSFLQDYASATSCEWLETNGLGGWSSSTLPGCNTRRYHGLLVAATHAPTERMVWVSKLEETIVQNGNRYELGTNDYGTVIHPQGYQYLQCFSKDIFPEWHYTAAGIHLKKTIAMVHAANTVLVQYEVISAYTAFTLELLPLIAVRDYHHLVHANDAINPNASFTNHVFSVAAYSGQPPLYIMIPGAQYQPDPHWYYRFHYQEEQNRGLDDTEDLFAYGRFHVPLKEGDTLGIILSDTFPATKEAAVLLAAEKQRRLLLLQEQRPDEMLRQLLLAADQFIVKRNMPLPALPGSETSAGATVIAGYHWFTDWSRDTMIALPGLTLSTGRLETAKKILQTFAQTVSQGMLPNRFTDNGLPPEYNNADGTLWYFIAVEKYFRATQDKDIVLQEILPVLEDIVHWHFNGTRYHIKVAEDGLLYAGEAGWQLTWMDAKVNGLVVTPRMGKPVEIQALWYNALCILAGLLQLQGQAAKAAMLYTAAAKAKISFNQLFWYAEKGYLYDNVDENGQPDAALRPNQLFAISLPYPLVEGDRAAVILRLIEDQLYTPVGLRSLSPHDPQYISVYAGDITKRDMAYHQGTVWSWLLGPYTDAIIKVYGSREKAQQVIQNFRYHLSEAAMGSVSEIFDGRAPHQPKGCVAQAWGVAEILRVIKDYGLSADAPA